MSYIGTSGSLGALRDGRRGFMGQLQVDASSIADGSITTAKLADNSVTSAKIVDGTIVAADLAATGAVAGTYGSATSAAVVAVNAQGQVTSITSQLNQNPMRNEWMRKTVPATPVTPGAAVTWGTATADATRVTSTASSEIQINGVGMDVARQWMVYASLQGKTADSTFASVVLEINENGGGWVPVDAAQMRFEVYAVAPIALGDQSFKNTYVYVLQPGYTVKFRLIWDDQASGQNMLVTTTLTNNFGVFPM